MSQDPNRGVAILGDRVFFVTGDASITGSGDGALLLALSLVRLPLVFAGAQESTNTASAATISAPIRGAKNLAFSIA